MELRGTAKLSRAELVRLSGLKHDLITRVELGRMPLRYGDAVRWLPALVLESPTRSPVNPLWLIDDTQAMQVTWPLLLPKPEYIGIPHRIRFSEFVADHRKLLDGLTKKPPEGDLPESWIFPYAAHFAEWRRRQDRTDRGVAWLRGLWENSAEQLKSKSPVIARLLCDLRRDVQRPPKIDFDTISQSANIGLVKSELPDVPEMPNLLSLLRKATVERGVKAELARAMGVSLPRISQWLAGPRQPGGEYALKLLQWVWHPAEGQRKNADSETTLSAHKAQSAKVTSNEKRKPNRPKR